MQLRYKKTERFDTSAPVTNGVRLRKRGEGGFFGCRHKGFGIKKSVKVFYYVGTSL